MNVDEIVQTDYKGNSETLKIVVITPQQTANKQIVEETIKRDKAEATKT